VTILAGCDFVLEISHAALMKQLHATPVIGGQTLQAPFDLTIHGALGSAHVMVDEVILNINGDNTLTLDLVFSRSSVTGMGQEPVSLYPLAGTITVNLRVLLASDGLTLRWVELDFTQSLVTLTLTPDTLALLELGAARSGRSVAQLTAGLQSAVRDYLTQQPSAVVTGGYVVTPTVDGTLQPLSFRTLRLHCFGPAEQNMQGIGLFGNFFGDTAQAGNPANRVASAVPAGEDTLLALSQRAFEAFSFCPSLAQSLAARMGRPQPLTLDELPSQCGRAADVDVDGVKITSLRVNFGPAYIQIDTDFTKSGPCYEAVGAIPVRVALTLNGQSITPTVTPLTPTIHVDVDFWCQFAAWVFTGPLGGWTTDLVRDLFVDVSEKLAVSAIGEMTNLPFRAPPIPGVRLTGVTVTSQEFSLTGRMILPWPVANSPALALELVSKRAILPDTKRHVWRTQLWCQNQARNYLYFETLQTQVQSFGVRSQLIPLPLTINYSIRGGLGPWLPLVPDPGVAVIGRQVQFVTVTNLQCQYPEPLSAGGSVIVRDVSLEYSVRGNQVTLISRDGEGNFAVDLRAEVLDATGKPPVGVDPSPAIGVFFDSDVVVMDQDYLDDLKECADRAKAISSKYAKSQAVPRWKQAFTARESEILDDFRVLNASGTLQGEDMARHYRNAYGGLLWRAAAAQQSTVPGLDPAERAAAHAIEQLDKAVEALHLTLSRLPGRQ
jgi:hypothetical protein